MVIPFEIWCAVTMDTIIIIISIVMMMMMMMMITMIMKIQLTIKIIAPTASKFTNLQDERKVCLVECKCVGGEPAVSIQVNKACKEWLWKPAYSGIGLLYHISSLTPHYGINDNTNAAVNRRYVCTGLCICMQMKGPIWQDGVTYHINVTKYVIIIIYNYWQMCLVNQICGRHTHKANNSLPKKNTHTHTHTDNADKLDF